MQNPFNTDNENLSNIVLSRATDSISTELDGETVILNIETGVYNGLDQVGTTVWNLLEKPATFASLTSSIINEYDVSQDQCVKDLCGFLKDMLDNRLIDIKNVGSV